LKKRLVTTALEDAWGTNEHLIFLGEWCRLYERRHIWNIRTHEVLSYHWADRAKFAKDHDYLQDLYERVLSKLGAFLNETHGVDYPKEYWRIVTGPWLLTMVSILWDRWENVRLGLASSCYDSICLVRVEGTQFISIDYKDFTRLVKCHYWNQNIFNQIIDFLEIPNIEWVEIKSGAESQTSLKSRSSYKMYLKKWVDQIFHWVPVEEKVLFHNSYFSIKSLAMLSLRLGQMPRLHFEFEGVSSIDSSPTFQRNHLVPIDPKDLFEDFLSKYILKHIPKAYLENYLKICKQTEQIHTQAKVIFTAVSHFMYDGFKIWAAGQKLRGTKLIVSEHGGALRSKFSIFDHEESIADCKAVWHQPHHPKQYKLSPNKLIGMNMSARKIGDYLTLIGYESPLFSYRCQSGPGTSLILEDYEQKKRFIKLLGEKSKNALRIRPSSNRGWNTQQRYLDDFGLEHISKKRKISEDISQSRIVICTYPQTTFSEVMHSGVPTILLYLEKYWELDPAYCDLLQILKRAEIVFTDPSKAADHINRVWEDSETWWQNLKVKEAREEFFYMCGRVQSNWLEEWTSFFWREINN
jgi:putative transferase (TIGR04331 family)